MHATLKPAVRVEWRGLGALGDAAEAWRALAARALEPNVFYEPAFALAAAPVFGRDAGAVLVWSGSNRLIGLFPARIERRGPLTRLAGWTHPYAPFGAPLVDRDEAEAAIAAWLDHLAATHAAGLLLLPLFPSRAVRRGARRGAGARAAAQRSVRRHARALLAPAGVAQDYLDARVGREKRKELRRQRRRLDDIAPLTFETARDAADDRRRAAGLPRARGERLEGPRRHRRASTTPPSAISCRAPSRRWPPKAGARRPPAPQRPPVAATITLRSGDTAWCWKIAYDEGLGALLARRAAHARRHRKPARPTRQSRASIPAPPPDHPMIDHLWRERLALCRPADRGERPRWRVCVRLPCSNAAAAPPIAGAKALRDRLRRDASSPKPAARQAIGPSPAATAGSPCRSSSSASRR